MRRASSTRGRDSAGDTRRADRPAGDSPRTTPATAAASSATTIQSSHGTYVFSTCAPAATVYVHVRDPGGDSDGDELARASAGRLARYGHGSPIGLTSHTTSAPSTNTATAARRGPCQREAARSRTAGVWERVSSGIATAGYPRRPRAHGRLRAQGRGRLGSLVAVKTQPRPAELPLAGGSANATVRVHPLRCGEVLMPPRALDRPPGRLAQQRALLGARRSTWIAVPVPAFLVEHPTAGPLLVDTGFHASVQDKARRSLGRRQSWVLPARQAPGESAPEQLRERGIDPGDVATILMTHLHNDHASGATQFPRATFVVDAVEWIAACEGGFAQGYRHAHFDQPFHWRTVDYGDAGPYATFHRTLDVFGDGSVRLLSTRGHTRGHQSLLFRLAGREMLLTADAAYLRRSIDEDLVPIFVFGGEDAYRRSLAQIRAFVDARPDAVVICGHDHERWPQLERTYA